MKDLRLTLDFTKKIQIKMKEKETQKLKNEIWMKLIEKLLSEEDWRNMDPGYYKYCNIFINMEGNNFM